jgi:hypothetical protein
MREVKHPRKWFLGMRVIGLMWKSPGPVYKQFHGVLVKNEYTSGEPGVDKFGVLHYPAVLVGKYTVLCDDGRRRKFNIVRKEV